MMAPKLKRLQIFMSLLCVYPELEMGTMLVARFHTGMNWRRGSRLISPEPEGGNSEWYNGKDSFRLAPVFARAQYSSA